MEKVLITASEAAAMLSMGRSTFFRKVTQGDLPQPVKFGGVTRWRVDDIRAVGQASQPTMPSAHDAEADIAHGCTQP